MSYICRIALAMSLFACSSSPTQVIVEIDADEAVRGLTRSLSIDISARALGDDGFQSVQLVSALAPESAWPLQHVLAPAGGDTDRTYRLSVSALDASGQVVVRARVSSGYVRDETRVLRVYLEAACLRVTCGEDNDSTCGGGTCIATPFIEPNLLPAPGGPVADAGADAMDSSIDAMPTCEGAGESCTLAASPCVVAHVVCEGELPVCTPDAGSPIDEGRQCGDAEGECSLPSVCSAAGECTPQSQPDNTPCEDGVCNGGVCTPCGGACVIPGTCELGELTCETDTSECVATGAAQVSGEVCRRATGPCDEAEVCDGMSLVCPTDALKDAGEECGELSRGGCDANDVCDGESAMCPNTLQPSGFVCRPSIDGEICDQSEACDGTSDRCPTDVYNEDLVEVPCRESTATCDSAEFCQRASGTDGPTRCPEDTGFRTGACMIPETGSAGTCVADGRCVDDLCNEPCELDAQPCMRATYVCSSGSPVCTSTGVPRAAGASCGDLNASNPCDLANECDGTGSCVDLQQPDGEPCGGAPSGACAAVPTCQSGVCTPRFQPSGQVCRTASECVNQQRCSGTSAGCPASNAPANTDCGSAGPCVMQTCDGSGSCGEPSISPANSSCDIPAQSCRVGMCNDGGECQSVITPGADCPGGVCLDDGGCFRPLVISEVGIPSSGSTDGGFVEIYNASPTAVSIAGCRLNYRVSTSTNMGNISLAGVVPGYGFYLVGNVYGADVGTLVNIGAAYGHARLECGAAVDTVGWGNQGAFEGSRLLTPMPGRSFERKACADSTTTSMTSADETRGNSYDSNDNATDFVVRPSGQPQSSSPPRSSLAEVPACLGT